MPIAHQFEYARPKTLDEAIRILSDHGQRAFPLAGGTDLIPLIREELLAPEILVDIKGIDGLRGIVQKESGQPCGQGHGRPSVAPAGHEAVPRDADVAPAESPAEDE